MRKMSENAMRVANGGGRYLVEFRAYTCGWWSRYCETDSSWYAQQKAIEANQYRCWVRLTDKKNGTTWYY